MSESEEAGRAADGEAVRAMRVGVRRLGRKRLVRKWLLSRIKGRPTLSMGIIFV